MLLGTMPTQMYRCFTIPGTPNLQRMLLLNLLLYRGTTNNTNAVLTALGGGVWQFSYFVTLASNVNQINVTINNVVYTKTIVSEAGRQNCNASVLWNFLTLRIRISCCFILYFQHWQPNRVHSTSFSIFILGATTARPVLQ
jgi:hypothetical protein